MNNSKYFFLVSYISTFLYSHLFTQMKNVNSIKMYISFYHMHEVNLNNLSIHHYTHARTHVKTHTHAHTQREKNKIFIMQTSSLLDNENCYKVGDVSNAHQH